MDQLEGRVAVVTGAASGIGRALASRFAAEGMNVAIADIESQPLMEFREALTENGASVLAIQTDVTQAAQVDALAAEVRRAFGAVHVLCNNAGVQTMAISWETSLDDWKWILEVNLWGVVHGLRSFLPAMVESGEPGHIVNTASMSGHLSAPGLAAYSASKFAVVAISETLRQEIDHLRSPYWGVGTEPRTGHNADSGCVP